MKEPMQFQDRSSAESAMFRMRGWPERRVVCKHEPAAKLADIEGNVFYVEVAPGRYLLESGNVGT